MYKLSCEKRSLVPFSCSLFDSYMNLLLRIQSSGFENYLMDESQELFNPLHRTVYQDMSKPMTHYFIASSYKTSVAEILVFRSFCFLMCLTG